MVPEQVSKVLIGSRIEVCGHKGTVCYIGDVVNTKGDWLGIDWDDPKRGKHDGTHENIQYFKASYPTSGSFVRPGKVNLGFSCVEAIERRYGLIDDIHAGVDLQSLAEVQREIKAKFIEVVGAEKLNKQQRFANVILILSTHYTSIKDPSQDRSEFKNLQVVLLRDQLVNGAGPPPGISRVCPNIRELDLSSTLLNSWTQVAEIICHLKRLKILNISDNRLFIPEDLNKEAFDSVEHVILGRSRYTWDDLLQLAGALLNVETFQVPFNIATHLSTPSKEIFQKLTCLDLEGNQVKSWDEINKLGSLTTLELLNVTNCGIEDVYFPLVGGSCTTALFPRLRHLILSDNGINNWLVISELDKLFSLNELKFKGNPVLSKESLETNRQLIIVRIKKLKVLNGIEILSEERRGAEFDFLKRHGLEWLASKTEVEKTTFNKLYPCYQSIVDKLGPPEESELKKQPTSLKSQLIQIEIFSPDHEVKSYFKKIPYNMSVQKLAGLIQRLFNTGYEVPRLSCIYSKGGETEVPLDNQLKELGYYSIENGDKIAVRW